MNKQTRVTTDTFAGNLDLEYGQVDTTNNGKPVRLDTLRVYPEGVDGLSLLFVAYPSQEVAAVLEGQYRPWSENLADDVDYVSSDIFATDGKELVRINWDGEYEPVSALAEQVTAEEPDYVGLTDDDIVDAGVDPWYVTEDGHFRADLVALDALRHTKDYPTILDWVAEHAPVQGH